MTDKGRAIFSSEALIGSILQGNYLIDKAIGKGGMAWVFKATHTKLKEAMAVKILLPHIAEDAQVRERFLDEAKIQFRLKHPNIVSVTDVITDGDLIGIVMEWVQGEDLKEFLKTLRQPLPLKEIWKLMAPVLDAVGYAHKKMLIHRDLKPANILLHHEPDRIVPKVTDFGIAKILDEAEEGMTRTGVAMGTIKYMAPEQILDSKSVDQRADVYSLGVMLYLMATGRLPFKGENQMVVYRQMNEDPPPPSSHYPAVTPEFEAVILKCLARDRDQRYQSCAEVSHSLSMALLESTKRSPQADLTSIEVQEILRTMNESADSSASHSYPSGLPTGTGGSRSGLSSTNERSFLLDGKPVSSSPGTKSEIVSLDIKHGDRSPPSPSPPPSSSSSSNRADWFDPPQATNPPHPSPVQKPPSSAPEVLADEPPRRSSLAPLLGGVAVLLLALIGILLFWPPSTPTKPRSRSDASFGSPRDPVPTPPVNPGNPADPGNPTQGSKTLLATQPPATCREGETRACFTGSIEAASKGLCKSGTQTCSSGKWGDCQGQILPQPEICDDKDNDCNGKIDETFPTKGQACQSSQGGCPSSGIFTCKADGSDVFCKIQPGSQSLGSLAQIILSPAASFSIKYGGASLRASKKACLDLKKRTSITITSSGYYTCSFSLEPGKKASLKMKRRSPDDLDPPMGYCFR